MKRLIFLILPALLLAVQVHASVDDGVNAYNRGDYGTALEIFSALAKQDDPIAQFNLGAMYANGRGVPKDMTKAYVWTERALSNVTPGRSQQHIQQALNAIRRQMTPQELDRVRAGQVDLTINVPRTPIPDYRALPPEQAAAGPRPAQVAQRPVEATVEDRPAEESQPESLAPPPEDSPASPPEPERPPAAAQPAPQSDDLRVAAVPTQPVAIEELDTRRSSQADDPAPGPAPVEDAPSETASSVRQTTDSDTGLAQPPRVREPEIVIDETPPAPSPSEPRPRPPQREVAATTQDGLLQYEDDPAIALALNYVDPERTTPPSRSQASGMNSTARYTVQMGAFVERSDADAHLEQIRRRFQTLLQEVELGIDRVNRNSKGNFFRVRAGDFAERSGASLLCSRIKQAGGDCFVSRQ